MQIRDAIIPVVCGAVIVVFAVVATSNDRDGTQYESSGTPATPAEWDSAMRAQSAPRDTDRAAVQPPLSFGGRRESDITGRDTATLAGGEYVATWRAFSVTDAPPCTLVLRLHRTDSASASVAVADESIGSGGTGKGSVDLVDIPRGHYAVEGSANCWWSLSLIQRRSAVVR